jgi:hypothetical protein
MEERDREILGQLLERTERLHGDLAGRIDDLRDEVHAQSEGIMRIIDRLGPADPPDRSP